MLCDVHSDFKPHKGRRCLSASWAGQIQCYSRVVAMVVVVAAPVVMVDDDGELVGHCMGCITAFVSACYVLS